MLPSSSRRKGPGRGVLEPASNEEATEKINSYMAWFTDKAREDESPKDWSNLIVPHLTLQSVDTSLPHPRATFRLVVKPIYCNALQNMHGGCTSTIFDITTSMVLYLINRPGFWQYMGVSRTLNCTYLRPIPVGSTVDIDCDILQVGKSLTTLRGTMRSVDQDGKLGSVLAVCDHGKVTIDPPAEKL